MSHILSDKKDEQTYRIIGAAMTGPPQLQYKRFVNNLFSYADKTLSSADYADFTDEKINDIEQRLSEAVFSILS
jgi:hypothetical protein